MWRSNNTHLSVGN